MKKTSMLSILVAVLIIAELATLAFCAIPKLADTGGSGIPISDQSGGAPAGSTEVTITEIVIVAENPQDEGRQIVFDVFFSNGEFRRDSFLVTNQTQSEIEAMMRERAQQVLENIF